MGTSTFQQNDDAQRWAGAAPVLEAALPAGVRPYTTPSGRGPQWRVGGGGGRLDRVLWGRAWSAAYEGVGLAFVGTAPRRRALPDGGLRAAIAMGMEVGIPASKRLLMCHDE